MSIIGLFWVVAASFTSFCREFISLSAADTFARSTIPGNVTAPSAAKYQQL